MIYARPFGPCPTCGEAHRRCTVTDQCLDLDLHAKGGPLTAYVCRMGRAIFFQLKSVEGGGGGGTR